MNKEEKRAKKALVIVDHPSFDSSVINRRWVEELRKYPDEILVHNLQSSYPSGSIDAVMEHSLIDNADTIVFQFPMYWYFCPPRTKLWLDMVLTRDWAFGKNFKLENKNIGLAITCGSEESAYDKDGRHHIPARNYLLAIEHAFEMCHASIKGMYAFYGAANKDIATVENIAKSAIGYVDFIRNLKA